MLAGYLHDGTKSQLLPDHGVVAALCAAGIIGPAPMPGTSLIAITGGPRPYLIRDWAWDHLIQHPELLDGVQPLPGPGPYAAADEGRLFRGDRWS